MGALLDPAVPRSNAKAYYRLRGMFSQKIVDFVAQRRSDGGIVAIIELDDRTHNSDKDAKRDQMLQSAGYRIVRWQSKTKPDAVAIRAELSPPLLFLQHQQVQQDPQKRPRVCTPVNPLHLIAGIRICMACLLISANQSGQAAAFAGPRRPGLTLLSLASAMHKIFIGAIAPQWETSGSQ